MKSSVNRSLYFWYTLTAPETNSTVCYNNEYKWIRVVNITVIWSIAGHVGLNKYINMDVW